MKPSKLSPKVPSSKYLNNSVV